MAACLYCRICLNKLAPGETFDIKHIKDYSLYQKLDEYCQGKGRNKRTSAFEEQLKDLAKTINFNAMNSVREYINEVKVMLDWPSSIANTVGQMQQIFLTEENQMVVVDRTLPVTKYTALLFYIYTLPLQVENRFYKGFRVQDQDKIAEKF